MTNQPGRTGVGIQYWDAYIVRDYCGVPVLLLSRLRTSIDSYGVTSNFISMLFDTVNSKFSCLAQGESGLLCS